MPVFDKDKNQLADAFMKMSKGKDKRVMITSHWMDVVQKMRMKEGQACFGSAAPKQAWRQA